MRSSSSVYQHMKLFLTEALLFLGSQHTCHALSEIKRPGKKWEGCQG